MLADCTDLNMGECISAFIRSNQRQAYISALPVETDLYFEKGGGEGQLVFSSKFESITEWN